MTPYACGEMSTLCNCKAPWRATLERPSPLSQFVRGPWSSARSQITRTRYSRGATLRRELRRHVLDEARILRRPSQTLTATLDDFREAVTKSSDLGPDARRVLGGEHPIVSMIERDLERGRLRKMLRPGM